MRQIICNTICKLNLILKDFKWLVHQTLENFTQPEFFCQEYTSFGRRISQEDKQLLPSYDLCESRIPHLDRKLNAYLYNFNIVVCI